VEVAHPDRATRDPIIASTTARLKQVFFIEPPPGETLNLLPESQGQRFPGTYVKDVQANI